LKQNRYSIYKILKFDEKIKSLKSGEITPPIMVYINPTNRCNHKCWFCVYDHRTSGMHPDVNFSDELSFDRMFALVDELYDAGVKAVTFSGGGEPLCYKDIDKVFEKLIGKGIDVGLITNAQLLCGSHAKALSKAKWIRISADYYEKSGFVKSRGVSDASFDRIVENIESFLKTYPTIDVGMNYVITADNYASLKDAALFWKERGLKSIRFSPVWISNFEEYHRPMRDLVRYDLEEVKKNLSGLSFEVQDSYKIDLKSQYVSECRCLFMQAVTVIASDGNVYACHNMSYDPVGKIGSIKDMPFDKMWGSEEVQKVIDSFDPRVSCKNRQCANKAKVEFYNSLVDTSWDNFV